MNIVLIGYRCTGKSSVGKILAKTLGKDFIDTDLLIEDRVGCDIEAWISKKGWYHFRRIEKTIISEVSKKNNLIIATGGGAVLDEENVTDLKDNGFLVWLTGDVQTLKDRMSSDQGIGNNRPSLTGVDPTEEIKKVLKQREPLYRGASDFNLDTSKLSLQDVADTIILNLSKTHFRSGESSLE